MISTRRALVGHDPSFAAHWMGDEHPERPAPSDAALLAIDRLGDRIGRYPFVDFDPVTRVAGALAFHSAVDMKERRVIEARSMATLFRGQGRPGAKRRPCFSAAPTVA